MIIAHPAVAVLTVIIILAFAFYAGWELYKDWIGIK